MKGNTIFTIDDFLFANRDRFEAIGQRSEAARHIITGYRGVTPGSRNFVVLHGLWAHEKALAAGLTIHSFLLCPSIAKWPEVADIIARCMNVAERRYLITARTFARITDYGDPDGILSLARIPVKQPDELMLGGDSVIFVLDGLTKPGNVGVILRSCDGAGVDAVAVCNLRTRVTHPNAVKASMGAVFSMPVVEFESADACKAWLLAAGFTIYIADPNMHYPYDGLRYPGRIAVVLGNEHKGPSRVWYDGSAKPLSIPMLGTCDSLNVSVAASIFAYEIQSKRAEI